MSSTVSDPPQPASAPVSLRGLFLAAAEFVRELGHVDLEQDGMSVLCLHGHIEVQVLRGAANIENRRAVVGDAASLLNSDARISEHTHVGSDADIWGTFAAYGHYMEAPLWCFTAVTPAEAATQGWGSLANVIELPLNTAGGEQ